MSANLQSHIFYEIALTIGNTNNLSHMLRDVLPVLVRKLTCRAGVVYQRDAQGSWLAMSTVPRRVKGLGAIEEIEKHLKLKGPLPCVIALEGQKIYLNEIPLFGAIALVKSGQPLSDEIRFSLPQLYEKLGHACQSCIQAEKIKKSEALYRALVETSRDAILMSDFEGNISFASPTATDVYGWSSEELTGATFELSLSLTIDKKIISAGLKQMRAGQAGSLPPYRIFGKHKETRWLDHSWNIVGDEDSDGKIIHFVRDITSKVNQELQHTAMLKVVPAAIYYRRLHQAGNAFFISDQIEHILGVKPEEALGQPDFFKDHLHPDDREWVLAIQENFNPHEQGSHEAITYRMLDRDGNTVWILNHVHIVRLADGTPEYVCGVLMDVTESKATEETLALEEKKRERLQRLLSPSIAQEVISGNVSMEKGGELRETTILFTDIRGFTAMSEATAPQMIVNLLNDYFERMIEVLFKYEGTLDKFVGDEIMALFGAPVAHSDDPLRAVKTALEMRDALANFNTERSVHGLPPIRIGMGINTGECIAGYLGSSQALDYTVIGDSVNVASRLCSLAKAEEIIISETTYLKVKEHIVAQALVPAKVKGKTEPLINYLVTGLKNS